MQSTLIVTLLTQHTSHEISTLKSDLIQKIFLWLIKSSGQLIYFSKTPLCNRLEPE